MNFIISRATSSELRPGAGVLVEVSSAISIYCATLECSSLEWVLCVLPMPINARRLIRKMRGGAQAHLLECDDGHFYVVKFRNNPQHRRILVNEWFAGVFLRYLQIAVPDTAIVETSAAFLEKNPEVCIQ